MDDSTGRGEAMILVDGVSKGFAIHERPHGRLLELMFPGRVPVRVHKALDGVSFSVQRGETVGIVGRNGSGKSTLLQIICGTLEPSTGRVACRGRIAALLELGAGFNPEFTGRENVYFQGAVLGMSREEVDARYRDIVAFSEIGDFIDHPVKTYSSGMFVRLAFAVAVHVDPDILVVDEALSVGDEAFQRKCFARIEAIRARGATILFVSHSSGTVVDLCDRALLLDDGELLCDGPPRDIVARYQRLLFAPAGSRDDVRKALRGLSPQAQQAPVDGAVEAAPAPPAGDDEAFFDEALQSAETTRYENRGATIEDPRLETPDGRRVNAIVPGREYAYAYRVVFSRAAVGVRCGLMVRTTTGIELGGTASALPGQGVVLVEAGQVLDVRFRFTCRLAPGIYFLNAGVSAVEGEDMEYLDRRIDVAMFRVLPGPPRLATGPIDLGFLPDVRLVSP